MFTFFWDAEHSFHLVILFIDHHIYPLSNFIIEFVDLKGGKDVVDSKFYPVGNCLEVQAILVGLLEVWYPVRVDMDCVRDMIFLV